MCAPSKIHMLKPNLQCDGVRRWGLWEVIRSESGAFMNEISVLIKETPERSLTLSIE